jgi:hypothetical protein
MCASSQLSPRVITCASAAFVTESICFICSTVARSLAMARTSSCRSRSVRAAFSCTVEHSCMEHHDHLFEAPASSDLQVRGGMDVCFCRPGPQLSDLGESISSTPV